MNAEQHNQKVKEARHLIYEEGPTFMPNFTWVDLNVYNGFVGNFANTRRLATDGLFLSDRWLTL